MQKNTETKSIEDWVQHLKSLTPEERRDFVIQMREEQIKINKKLIVFSSISAPIISFASLYLWGHAYHMSRESTFGMLTGSALFFIGFQFIKSGLLYEPFKNCYLDDFTDEDIFAYLQGISKGNQKSSRLEKIGKFYFFIVSSALLIPFFLHFSNSSYEFSTSASGSAMSTLMICYSVYLYKKIKMNKSN
ncbi:MAG: hypothetical protein HYZ25_18830 [Chloroflexi bacterium]|nr:hypothetical protein [Chloroflexota bacterium]